MNMIEFSQKIMFINYSSKLESEISMLNLLKTRKLFQDSKYFRLKLF